MSVDWRVLSKEAGLSVRGYDIQVPCGAERRQVVQVDDKHPDGIRLWSLVVTRGDADRLGDTALRSWKMNRFRELVGFKIVEYGRVIGESWVPRIAVTAEEWRYYVVTLGHACDRLEYLWTGRDVE